MYYNIKITTNGSEFSLNSNDKEITQNEMDKYFAEILDVSEEFRANLKHVEVQRKNLKSIKDVETIAKQEPIREIETPVSIKEIKSENAPCSIPSQEEIERIIEQKVQQLTQPKPTPEVNVTQTPAPQTIIQKQQKNDIDELISQAQEKFSSFNSKEESKTAIKEEKVETQQPTPSEINIDEVEIPSKTNEVQNSINKVKDEESEEKTQDLLNSIFNFNPDSLEENINKEQPNEEQFKDEIQEIETPIKEIKLEEIEIKEELTATQEAEEQVALEQVELSIKEAIDQEFQEEIKPTPTENLPPEIEQYIATDIVVPEFNNLAQKADETIELQEEICISEESEETVEIPSVDEIVEEETPKKEIVLCEDFKEFLSNFVCQDVYDEFIICAYQIKKALNQEDFTMKYINSKLFQASGKIANLSIVDELIAREYIKVIETEDSKKYTITPSGENYFLSRFQG